MYTYTIYLDPENPENAIKEAFTQVNDSTKLVIICPGDQKKAVVLKQVEAVQKTLSECLFSDPRMMPNLEEITFCISTTDNPDHLMDEAYLATRLQQFIASIKDLQKINVSIETETLPTSATTPTKTDHQTTAHTPPPRLFGTLPPRLKAELRDPVALATQMREQLKSRMPIQKPRKRQTLSKQQLKRLQRLLSESSDNLDTTRSSPSRSQKPRPGY